MEPVSLIVGALTAGLSDTARQAVKDAYGELRRRLATRFSNRPSAETALAEHDSDPVTWRAPLEKALTESGAAADPDIVAAAEAIMRLVDPDGAKAGKYQVDLRGAQGVQVGDHNQQANVFGASPTKEA